MRALAELVLAAVILYLLIRPSCLRHTWEDVGRQHLIHRDWWGNECVGKHPVTLFLSRCSRCGKRRTQKEVGTW